MRSVLVVLFIVFSAAAAAPHVNNVKFRNLYVSAKVPISTIPRPRIIGGHEAEPHSIPYQVFVTAYDNRGSWYCGGSLIEQNIVLTAAHCVDGASKTELVFGAHKPLELEDTQVIISSSEIIMHKLFDKDLLLNDIALIKLPQYVELNNEIQTIPLPGDDSIDFLGEIATVSGWGQTNGFAPGISKVLNTVDVKVISNEECSSHLNHVTDTNICTSGDESSGSCYGDAGGPLTYGGIQIGIVSFGIEFCIPRFPTAYTRVSKYLDWIAVHS